MKTRFSLRFLPSNWIQLSILVNCELSKDSRAHSYEQYRTVNIGFHVHSLSLAIHRPNHKSKAFVPSEGNYPRASERVSIALCMAMFLSSVVNI